MPTVFQPSSQEIVKVESRTCTVSQPTSPESNPIWLRLVMVCALYAIPVLATVQGDADYDVWWHLRIGEWVVQHHTVPITDPCSSYGQDRHWVAYSWLFEVLVYGFYTGAGLLGIVFFRLVLCLGVTAALHRFIARREPRFLIATALTAAATLGVAMLFKERPWLFTILFSILTLDTIVDVREGKLTAWAWTLPLIFVVWANDHIQFNYGQVFLFIACAAPMLEQLIHRTEGQAVITLTPSWRRILMLSAACFLATFLNPYTTAIYRVVIEYATQPGPFRYLNELKSLEFREPSDWIMLVLGAVACYALGRRQSLSCFDLLLFAFSGWLAFRSRRDMWVLILTSVYLITSTFRRPAKVEDAFAFTWPRAALVAGGVLLLTVAVFLVRNLSNASMKEEVAKTFPVKAAEFITEKGYSGPLYNDFNWGGYLIWALPQLPVAIDGRTNLHGDERNEHFGDVWAAIPDAADDQELLQAGVIISPKNSPRATLLLRDCRFEQVYSDDLARVFVRK